MQIVAEKTLMRNPKQNEKTVTIKCRMSAGFEAGMAHLK
jgi:hypothetical protein